MRASPMQYRRPFDGAGHPRYEALTLRLAVGGCHVGGDRPRWMPVRCHRAWLRLKMAFFVAWSIWRDQWGQNAEMPEGGDD